ncbi:MAG: hypothetical protein HN982_03940 [Candidatus Marinimicrobia bacterium]|nr:hypothetical protein [Candidatus Woesearchaeota archaeon]MBT6936718.1 hypothetical protein [Candidatus Neomarinimicrobiota bacterium]
MAFSVTEFKSNLKQGGARPSLFKVDFTYPSGITAPPTRSEFLVKATTIPASTIGSYDVYYHGKAIHVAGDRSFDTWDTTIINDEDFGIRNSLESWMASISNHTLNTRDKNLFQSNDKSEGDAAKYKTSLKVTQFSKAGNDLRTYIFKGAWPSALSTINLDWSSQEIEEFTCTWMYDSWFVSAATSASNLPVPPENIVGIG